ncbi:MAG: tryptophan--tRNA ligase [Clostridia bacterium]|nr:tryptophan--tRNA ligase [Clostridia bacterium]
MSNKKIILTGDRPTGRLHIGHYVGSLRRRVQIQNEGNFDKMYVMIADAQALTDNFDNPEKIRENIIEVALDYLSVGLDPSKITLFVQSYVKELTEITFYYMNLVTIARLHRNPTVKSEIEMRQFGGESIPAGFFTYPVSQAADITAFKGNIIPVGDDQLPMLEQTREIVRSFNRIYDTDILVEPKEVLPDNEACMRLPGTDGKAKMSKSLGNCIYLSDSSEELKKKIMGMYTDPNHIQVSDPGQVEGNMVFTYLDAFIKEDSFEKYAEIAKLDKEDDTLDKLKEHYKRGGLGDVKVKNFLYQILDAELAPIRERRKYYEARIEEVYKILEDGSKEAQKEAAKTLNEMKNAMKINYFEDKDLIASHVKKYENK